jgi:hypothetical protein
MSKRHVMFTLSLTTYPTTNGEPNLQKPLRILETGFNIAYLNVYSIKVSLTK